MSSSLRTRGAGGALSFALLALLSTSSLAQEAVTALPNNSTSSSTATQLEGVTVTGSRIKRAGYITPTPVTVLTSEDIKATGATSAGDVLNSLPQLASTFSQSNSNRFIGTVGLSLLDLRNLGTDRTLVLVNGRRHVGGTAGSAAVDVSSIPVELIERVEIITGGASAVYGADAVTGVVNFILKKRFNGLTLKAQTGKAEDSDFGRNQVAVTAGRDFDGKRGNAAFSFEANRQNRITAKDREATAVPTASIIYPNDPFNTLHITNNAGNYSLTPGGRFTVAGTPYLFNPDGSFRVQNIGSTANGTRSITGTTCANCDFYDSRRNTDLQPELDRYIFNTLINYKLDEGTNFFTEGKFGRARAYTLTQPAFNNGSATARFINIKRDNAYVSPQLAALMDANNLSSINVARMNFDAGFRGEDVNRDTARLVMGVEGSFWNGWEYNLSGNYGRVEEQRKNLNNRINDRFYLSTDAVRNSAGQIVCRSQIDPNATVPGSTNRPSATDAAACVPTSVFGEGAISEAARNYFNSTALSYSTVEQTVVGAYLSNAELFHLPAGPFGFSTGVEHREEKSSQQTDSLAATGATFLNQIPSLSGKFDVSEAYAEASAPLLAQLPGVKELRLDTAARYANYSTIGSALSYKFGLDWTVTQDARIRGTYSKALRAPNISELFGPQSQNFYSITDPCSSTSITSAPNQAVRRANCAALGIPAGFQNLNTSTRPGLSGGNPDLKEESSIAYTGGVVLTPRWIPNFGLTIDYWQIDIDDAIASPTGQQIADRCVDSTSGINNEFCARVPRAGPGGNFPYDITFVTQTLLNLQKLRARGVDIDASYSLALGSGRLTLNAVAQRLLSQQFFPFQKEQTKEEYRGLIGTPEWDAIFSATYRIKPLYFTVRTHFIEDSIRATSRQSFDANPYQQDPIQTGNKFYTDFSGGVQITKNMEFYAGINNAFQEVEPYGLLSTTGTNAIYDNIGRYYFGGITLKF